MAWIEIHQSLPSHRKTSRLMRELGIKTRAQAVGHLVMLWLWALDNAPDGNLAALDINDMAEAAGWTGKADKLWQALVNSGFLDVDGRVHDWDAYAGRLIDKRAANAKRNREARAKKRAQSETQDDESERITSASRAHHERITSASRDVATVPYPTVPNHTVPNHTGYLSQTLPCDQTGERENFPPTVDEVEAHARAAGLEVDAEAFVRVNEAAGWRDSTGHPIRNWRIWLDGYARMTRPTGNIDPRVAALEAMKEAT